MLFDKFEELYIDLYLQSYRDFMYIINNYCSEEFREIVEFHNNVKKDNTTIRSIFKLFHKELMKSCYYQSSDGVLYEYRGLKSRDGDTVHMYNSDELFDLFDTEYRDNTFDMPELVICKGRELPQEITSEIMKKHEGEMEVRTSSEEVSDYISNASADIKLIIASSKMLFELILKILSLTWTTFKGCNPLRISTDELKQNMPTNDIIINSKAIGDKFVDYIVNSFDYLYLMSDDYMDDEEDEPTVMISSSYNDDSKIVSDIKIDKEHLLSEDIAMVEGTIKFDEFVIGIDLSEFNEMYNFCIVFKDIEF